MKIHIRVHTGGRPFCCATCGTCMYVTKYQLVKHEMTHTREKKNLCDACGKSCIDKHDLLKHMKKHTGEKPYLCSICGKKFKLSSSLQKHRMRHTE